MADTTASSPSKAPQILDPRTQWASQYMSLDEMMDRALQTFYLGVDKELAAAAAYKALGLDPRDAPKFGWGLMQSAANTAAQMAGGGIAVSAPGDQAAAPATPAPAAAVASTAPGTPTPSPAAPASSPPSSSQGGIPWWQAALAGAGVTMLPALGYGVAKLLNPTTPPMPSPAAPATTATTQAWQAQWEFKAKDGSWQPMGPPTVLPNP